MKKGHRTLDHSEEDIEPVPRFSMDYGYMNRKDEEYPEETDKLGDSPILVMVDEKTWIYSGVSVGKERGDG